MTTETLLSQQEAAIAEVLAAYPEKAKKSREKHLGVDMPEGVKGACDSTKSNKQTVPGVMSQRGCAYAGSKGVVWGPVKDMIHISHGPVGCGQYSRAGRRNYYIGTTGVDTYVTMNFTTDYNEKDIVFGGDKKLKAALAEIDALFPLNNGISIQSECPIGLIGDDIQAVAKGYKKESGKPTVAVSCEGFRGVSQSLGHHIANDMIRDEVLPDNSYKKDFVSTPYDVAIIGDYNIGGDAWSSRILLEEMGLRVIAQWSGDATYKELTIAPKAKINLLHCYRSMNYVVRHMEQEFGVPWMEYNFFGPSKTTESLRKIAAFFDETIQAKTEAVIAKYTEMTDKVIAKYRPKLEGKTVMLYVGGLRPRHVIGAYEDLGMKIIGTGYEFGHGDDYKRTKDELSGSTLIYDDTNEYELEQFVKRLKPDLVASGVKEKYVFQKMGLPFRQMHSWDYSGPYHGYDAFAIFAKDMDLALNSPVWAHTKAPWESN
ncbi:MULTISPECIES: nitrogenase molybdenum-iron protein alpha chain [Sulfurospirillum]|uniref:Nitrogenase protein alpha chain n=4 Tax=Sulfurospirillum TaxID=57665 RepID=A0AA86DXW0_SULMK|nr:MULTISPECIES: nitrogenase molybdenum-iron protein alpha chain [Sulfurospirillum]AHJ12548.1 nitrogenase (molybdenum-iron) alpha chain [Sulfurospirillum multivorans DSM 12446]QEH06043.1 nitrogenase (molybdenum-iron) alpha chain [Sulfurospirillum multivorans]QIR77036.1 nitrogenase molybdenum-iron protein alpha chain [Sulfurospirillum diekertiae]